jgi:hypothetical protein
VDYDRSNFSVYQASFPSAATPQNLVTIELPAHEAGRLGTGAIAGVAVAVLVIAIVSVVSLLWWRRRKNDVAQKARDAKVQEPFVKAELDGSTTPLWSTDPKHEMQGVGVSEVEGSEAHNSMFKADWDTLQKLSRYRSPAVEAGGHPVSELTGTEAASELPDRRERYIHELP